MPIQPSPGQMNILLVEDNADDAFLTQEAFESLSIPPQFTVSDDGVSALEHLKGLLDRREPLPDLLLLDLNMPRMDGFGLLQAVKANPELRHLPVLIFSTSNAPNDIRRSYHEHANSYICKPRLYAEYEKVVQAVHTFWMQTASLPH